MKLEENHGEVDVVDDYDETPIKQPPKPRLNLHPTKFLTQRSNLLIKF